MADKNIWDLLPPEHLADVVAKDMSLELEREKYSLLPYFPNYQTNNISVSFDQVVNSRVTMAQNRAYDAEPTRGTVEGYSRASFELPAVGQKLTISEYARAKSNNASEEELQALGLNYAVRVARSIAELLEYQRGKVLTTGQFSQNNTIPVPEQFDDFKRPASMDVVAAKKWSDPSTKVLDELMNYVKLYEDTNGFTPETMIVSRKLQRAIFNAPEFRTVLNGGATRPGTEADVNALLTSYGIPALKVYERKVNTGDADNVRVLDENSIYLLPGENAPVGHTFWAPTVAAKEFGWPASAEGPQIFTGIFRAGNVAPIAEVVADAYAAPVLVNPSRAFVAKVL